MDKNFEVIRSFTLKCNHCGEEFSSGLKNVSDHVNSCEKFPREIYDPNSLTFEKLKKIFQEVFYG